MEKKIEEIKEVFKERCNDGRTPNYERYCDHFPEDMVEDRTSWQELKELADEMQCLISEIREIVFRE